MKSATGVVCAAAAAVVAVTTAYGRDTTLVHDDGEPDNAFLAMPNGLAYHHSCLHHHPDHFEVERIDGTPGWSQVGATKLGPCPYAPRPLPTTRRDENRVDVGSGAAISYYSDWAVYVQTAGHNYTFMSSTWQVPAIPKKNQFGLASVYLFNGLQDGNGIHGASSLILQPVLLHGKSGCLPFGGGGGWHLGSYLVDGGRAHCGKHFRVQPGQTVVGTMNKLPTSNNTWNVESIAVPAGGTGANRTSTYTAHLKDDTVINAAFLTMEGMIVYNCQTYPAGGGVTFSEVSLHTEKGPMAHNQWTPVIRHRECAQATKVNDHQGTSVSLLWDSTIQKK